MAQDSEKGFRSIDSPGDVRATITANEFAKGAVQFVSFVTALVFGVWAIKSFNVAQEANVMAEMAYHQAVISNQLSFMAICTSNPVHPRIFGTLMVVEAFADPRQ